MSAFKAKLLIEYVDGETWLLVAPLVYESDRLGREFAIPAGFCTDFCSVPWGLRNTFPKTQYGLAGVVHDYLYRFEDDVTRDQADAVFLEALELLGAGWFRRRVMYLALRVAGWKAWKKGDDRGQS